MRPKFIEVGRWRARPHRNRNGGPDWWWLSDREGKVTPWAATGADEIAKMREHDLPRFSQPDPFGEYDHFSARDIADFEALLANLERFYP